MNELRKKATRKGPNTEAEGAVAEEGDVVVREEGTTTRRART